MQTSLPTSLGLPREQLERRAAAVAVEPMTRAQMPLSPKVSARGSKTGPQKHPAYTYTPALLALLRSKWRLQ